MSNKRTYTGGAARFKLPCCGVIACVVAVCLSGCGDSGLQRYQVSGNVTHDGKPVPKGSVLFQPEGSAGSGSEYGVAVIQDGRFDTAAEGGRGVLGGAYTVAIEAFDGSDVDLDMMPDGRSLANGYRKPLELPKEDSNLDFELTESSK